MSRLPIKEKCRAGVLEARGTDVVPARFVRALNGLLGTSGISPVQPARRVPARCTADESEALTTGHPADLPARFGRVVIFIEEHLEGPLSLDRLADEADLSKYYFSRRFRDEVGQTPWAYVREARIRKAKALLRQGASPTRAALEAGFFDQSHLTKVMRDVEGKTPGQYQQDHRADRKDLQE